MLAPIPNKSGIEVSPIPTTGLKLPTIQVRQPTETKMDGRLSLTQCFYRESDQQIILPQVSAYNGIDIQRLSSDFLQERKKQSWENFIKFENTIPLYLKQTELRSKYQLSSLKIAQRAIELCELTKAQGEIVNAFEWIRLSIVGSNGIPGLTTDPVLNIYKAMFILERLVCDPKLVGEAITCLKNSLLELDSKDANLSLVYKQLAIACSMSGEHDTAIECTEKLLTMKLDAEDRFDLVKIFARAGYVDEVFQLLSVGINLNLIYRAISDPDIARCFTLPSDGLEAASWLDAVRDVTLKSELGRFPELRNPEFVLIYESFLSKRQATSNLAQILNSTPSLFELPNFIDEIQGIHAEVLAACKQFTANKTAWRGEIINALEASINIDQNHWVYQRATINLLHIIADGYLGNSEVSKLCDIFLKPEIKSQEKLDIAEDFESYWEERMRDAYASVSRVIDSNLMIDTNPQIQNAISEYQQATDSPYFEEIEDWQKFLTKQAEILNASLYSQGAILELDGESYLAPHVAQIFFERYKSGAPFFQQDGALDQKFRETYCYSSLVDAPYGGGYQSYAERTCTKWSSIMDLMEKQLQAITHTIFCPPTATVFGVKFSEVISTERRVYLNYGSMLNDRLIECTLKPTIQFMNELAQKLDNADEHKILYNTLISDQSWSSKALCLIDFSPPSYPTRPRRSLLTRAMFSRSDDRKYNRSISKFEAHLARYQSAYESIQENTSYKEKGFKITPISIGIFLLAQGDDATMSLLR